MFDGSDDVTQEREESSQMRKELLELAERGEIAKTPVQIKKASRGVIQKLYASVKKKVSDGTVNVCSDSFIDNISYLACSLGIADDKEALAKDLKAEKTFKADVNKMVSYVLPWVPFVGLLAGGAVFIKHWFLKKARPESVAETYTPEDLALDGVSLNA